MAPFLKGFQNSPERTQHAFPVGLMRTCQSLAFPKSLPRNARDLAALHGSQLLIQLSLTGILQGRQKLHVLVHDIVRTPEGLRKHNVLEDVNGLCGNVGFLIKLSKRTIQITFTAYATSLWKSPFRFHVFGSLVIRQLLNV